MNESLAHAELPPPSEADYAQVAERKRIQAALQTHLEAIDLYERLGGAIHFLVNEVAELRVRVAALEAPKP